MRTRRLPVRYSLVRGVYDHQGDPPGGKLLCTIDPERAVASRAIDGTDEA